MASTKHSKIVLKESGKEKEISKLRQRERLVDAIKESGSEKENESSCSSDGDNSSDSSDYSVNKRPQYVVRPKQCYSPATLKNSKDKITPKKNKKKELSKTSSPEKFSDDRKTPQRSKNRNYQTSPESVKITPRHLPSTPVRKGSLSDDSESPVASRTRSKSDILNVSIQELCAQLTPQRKCTPMKQSSTKAIEKEVRRCRISLDKFMISEEDGIKPMSSPRVKQKRTPKKVN